MILFEDRAATILYNILTNIPNKKFLLPLNVCPIVPDTFLKAKKEFEFIDIELKTLCMDKDAVLNKIEKDNSIEGVLFVKTFGIELDNEPFYKQIKKINRDIFIINDMCPCIQRFDCDIENSYADMTLFSSGYSKYVDIGYGGYGFVKDLRFGQIFTDKSKDREFLEYKKIILDKIPKMKKHKKIINAIYKKNLPNEIFLGDDFNRWRFSILVDNKEEILQEIFKVEGLFASSHYPQVDYNYVANPVINSNTKKIHDKIINLFNDFRFTKEKALSITKIINKNLRIK